MLIESCFILECSYIHRLHFQDEETAEQYVAVALPEVTEIK